MHDRQPRLQPPPRNLVDLLRLRALGQPDGRVYTFLTDGETEAGSLCFGELDRRARAVGALLQQSVAAGERALLAYEPGMDYISAFFGCLYAGVIAIPVYLPARNQPLSRLRAILTDSGAKVVLTTGAIMSVLAGAGAAAGARWVVTDDLESDAHESWREPMLSGETLAFLQYTSGSTTAPRGVMISHDNLLDNLKHIRRRFEIGPDTLAVIWLPPYHDMGLIGGLLEAVYAAYPVVIMSPISFLQRPVRWLQAISKYCATVSGGPNFGYDLCARRVSQEQREGLDLSSWQVAVNGAEPISAQTMNRFVETFEPCGFRREAFYPCYGLAESTLLTAGGRKSEGPRLLTVEATALEQNRVVEAHAGEGGTRDIVDCGEAMPDHRIVIVDPESLSRCPPDVIGEIWMAGPSVAAGYWNLPDLTEQTFGGRLSDTGEGPFLRTGDLGFLRDGRLFVTGRLKDLIILHGRNYYPQDIERTVEQSHAALRPSCVAAFSIAVEEEQLVVVQEVDPRRGEVDPREVERAIRRAVADSHGVQLYAVALVGPGGVAKTSSGKVRRYACREQYLAGKLQLFEGTPPHAPDGGVRRPQASHD